MKRIGKLTCLFLLVLGIIVSLTPWSSVLAASVVSVTVCQAGYSANQLKIAVAVVTGGSLSDTSYQIIKASDSSQVSSGSMVSYTPSTWTRGETYYKIDFTSFNQTGDFKVKTNGVSSRQFTISNNIWTNYTDEAIEYYRIQRCGVNTSNALPSGFTNRPSAEALHTGACHADDAKKGSETGSNADMTGGWHDAGDNNKYQSNTGWVTGGMAITFLRHSGATFDYDSNGTPDLLDEARVGADNLNKIIAAAGAGGGVYDTVDAPNGAYYAWKYPTSETNGTRGDSDDRVGHTRSAANALSYDASMKTAGSLAAVARAFASRDAAFSNTCKNNAINAYNWALSHTGNTGGNYAISDQNNPRLWAAVELFLLTNDSTYGNWISSHVNGLSSISTSGTNYWGLQPIALAEYYPVAGSLQSKVNSLLSAAADNWRNGLVNPFGVQPLDGVTFGVNEPNMSKAADSLRLYEVNGNTAYRDAAIKAMQWTLGVNPFDFCFACGIGSNYPNHLHSRLDADGDSNASSTIKLPGFMACGPIWADTLNANSAHPWYQDRALANDGMQQWRYNEHSVSIQYAFLDMMVALAYGNGSPSPTPTPTTTPPAVTPTATKTPTPTVTSTTTPGAEQVFPAENGTLAGGATITNSANAENGAYVGNMHLSGASDTISGVNGGSGGSFNLTIRYATNDTNPTLNLYVNGSLVRTLTFTSTGGWETFSNLTTSITLNSGSGNTIMLKHDTSNTGGVNPDTFRVPGGGATPTPTVTPTATATPTPTVTKTPTPTSTPSGGTTTRYEGENATGVNQVDTWPSGYSGTGIGVKYPGTAMTWTKNFAGGAYTFKVHCNDYAGTQTFYIQLDAVDKGGPYTMTVGDKSWKDFTGSFGTVSAGNHTIGLRVSGSSNVYCDYIEVTGP